MTTSAQNKAMAKAVQLRLGSFSDGVRELVQQSTDLQTDIVTGLENLENGVSGNTDSAPLSIFEIEECLQELKHAVSTMNVQMTKGLLEQEAFLKPLRLMQGETSEEKAKRIAKKKERAAERKAKREAKKDAKASRKLKKVVG